MNKLDNRGKKILWAVIQSHIDLNVPIGSILITKRYPIGLSPATVRNALSKLEESGYIIQPHTSAGRVPTEKGYRFYVDTLLEEQSLSVSTALSDRLSSRLRIIKADNKLLITEAAKTLSTFSRYLALATPPRIENLILKRVKFIRYEQRKVLAILISDDGVVENKVIDLEQAHTQKQLDNAANHLNEAFSGLAIKKVKEKIAYQLYKERSEYDQLVANLLYVFSDIIPSEADATSLNRFSGTSNLTEFATMVQIKAILKAIEDKQFMLKLLERVSKSEGTQVIVGMEHILPSLKELSMVVSTYNGSKYAGGAIGIIGPTRMNYRKLIPIVDHTAKALTEILSEDRGELTYE